MPGRLILAFILIPLIELVLLDQMYQRTNLFITISVVFITGVVGANLARQQGRKAWLAVQQQMAAGKVPSMEILEGVLVLVAGAFLVTPGILTDSVGFLILIPKARRLLANRLSKWFKDRATVNFQSSGWQSSPFDVQSEEVSTEGETPSVRVVDPNAASIDQTDDNTSN